MKAGNSKIDNMTEKELAEFAAKIRRHPGGDGDEPSLLLKHVQTSLRI